ncbi:MAG: DNA polymerase III subunit beta [Lentisphaerae bacterium]|nr:DNA polymerase III subunit beta [Lentisphaerota bacterium]MBQ9804871.1 DNA polymerase III subunit beta [Lentisphaeria bacterium]
MKFTVDRVKLQKALQRVGNIIGSKSMLPLLGNVLIRAEENALELSTTDLELRLVTRVEAEVSVPGATTLPARKLVSLVGSFSAADVEIDVDEKDFARITCGTAKFTLHGLSTADFPEALNFTAVREVKIKENVFKRMIGSIAYAVSADDSRKVLTGVLLNLRETSMTLVATDGKRMAMQENTPDAISGGDGDAIIPLKAMSEIRRLLDGDEVMTIEIGDKLCRFTTANVTLTSKLIEGAYPNYRQVVPSKFQREVELPVQALLSKIETVALMLSEANSFIILRFGDNQLQLQASSAEVGEGSDLIETACDGEPFEVSFNPAFLADPLRNTDADMVRFRLNDPLSPVAIEAGEGFIYVIMPIRKK